MSYRFEATSNYFDSTSEISVLLDLAKSDNGHRQLFLKLALVSLVTKFQVFVENILGEYYSMLQGKKSKELSTYIKMNSLRISMENSNALSGITSHKHFNDEKKNNVVQYLNSINYIVDEECTIDNSFKFNTKYPLGKTGKKELVNLLKQIDGNETPFVMFDIDKIDALLASRHLIVHHDRFNGTDTDINNYVDYIKSLVEFIDTYISERNM